MSARPPTCGVDRLRKYLPGAWTECTGPGYARAYLMLGTPRSALVPPIAADLGDVCVVMAWMELPHFAVEATYIHTEGGGVHVGADSGAGELREPAPCALFIT